MLDIEKVISKLVKRYKEAQKLRYIHRPLSYALYHTWKEIDSKETDQQIDFADIGPYGQPFDIESFKSKAIRIIEIQRDEYYEKYGSPKYVKVPLNIYQTLCCTDLLCSEVTEFGYTDTIMGLVVCSTKAGSGFDDIEVF